MVLRMSCVIRFSSPITVPIRSRVASGWAPTSARGMLEVQPRRVDRLDDAVVQVAPDALALAQEHLASASLGQGAIGLLLEQLEAGDDGQGDDEPGDGAEDLDRHAERLEDDAVVEDRGRRKRRRLRHEPAEDRVHHERAGGHAEGEPDARAGHRSQGACRPAQAKGHEQGCGEREQHARDDISDGQGSPDGLQRRADLRGRQPRPGIRLEARLDGTGDGEGEQRPQADGHHRDGAQRARHAGLAGHADQQLDAELEEEREADRLHGQLQQEQSLDHGLVQPARPGWGRTGSPTP